MKKIIIKTFVRPTKPSLDDDSLVRNGFGAKTSLPLTQDDSAATYDTIRLFGYTGIVIRFWLENFNVEQFSNK